MFTRPQYLPPPLDLEKWKPRWQLRGSGSWRQHHQSLLRCGNSPPSAGGRGLHDILRDFKRNIQPSFDRSHGSIWWISRELNHLIGWKEFCVRLVACRSSPDLEMPWHIPATHGFPLHHVQDFWGVPCHKEKLSQILGANNSGSFKLERQTWDITTVGFNKIDLIPKRVRTASLFFTMDFSDPETLWVSITAIIFLLINSYFYLYKCL